MSFASAFSRLTGPRASQGIRCRLVQPDLRRLSEN